MGHYETEYWLNDTWGSSRAERKSGEYHPYVPDRLVGVQFCFRPETMDAVTEASERIAMLDGVASATESVATLLLRSEAISSSRIEGMESPIGKVLETEELKRMGVHVNPDAVPSAVLGNIEMMRAALDAGRSGSSISIDTIRTMHALLVRGTRAEHLGGLVREVQNWVGGNNANPIGATYVPPQPGHVLPLLEDLVAFCNESAYPPIVKAAIAHAQFEAIHPFVDGNGRTGRALVHVLAGKGDAVPPVSLMLAANRDRYMRHLAAYQSAESGEVDAAVDEWVRYFCESVTMACVRAEALGARLNELEAEWRERLHVRRASAADRILSLIKSRPVITTESASELTGLSRQACRLAINSLVESGILRQSAKNRKSGIYAAQDVLDAFNAFERAAATIGGSTASERPEKAVPQLRDGARGMEIPAL